MATYKVKSGDTLSGIAKNNNTTVVNLIAWNKDTYPSLASNSNVIKVGWNLVVSKNDNSKSHKHTEVSLKGVTIVDTVGQNDCPLSHSSGITVKKNTKVSITKKCDESSKYWIAGYGWIPKAAIQLDSDVDKTTATKNNPNKKESEARKLINSVSQSVNTVTSVIYNIEDLMVESSRGLLGIPYQFMDDVDCRLSDKVTFGHMFIDRIVSKMPLLLLSPGLPNFLPSFNKAEKNAILSSLVGLAGGNSSIADNIKELINPENGRYYTFEFKYNDYFYNVNKLCRYGAVALGIQDLVIQCNGTTKQNNKLGDMCWQNQVSRPLQNFINAGEYVAFYLDSETAISESFGNSTTSSQLAGTFNSLSDISRELQFLAGPIAGVKVEALNPEEFKDSLSELTQIANEALGNDKLFTHLEEGFKTIGKGGKLLFPEIWDDSDFSKSYDISMKLRSPDGDKVSWYFNIYVPLMHLYAMAAPRELGPNGYKSPYLVRGFYKGIFNCDMGIITSMSVSKGKEGAWTVDGLPTEVDVNITIKDLYGLLMTSGEKYTLAESPFKFFRNTALLDYLSCTCGININEMEITRIVKTYVLFAKRQLADVYGNSWLKLNNGLTNFVSTLYRNVVFYGNG